MNGLKAVLKAIASVLKILFPKNRWANLIYLVIGFLLASWVGLMELIDALRGLF